MKWLATKRVLIKSIVLPGNFAATKAAARIMDLATSVREHGVIQLPVAEAKTMRLVVGHDRIAALLALREKHAEVRMWEGTAREFRRMQVAENLHRRADDRDALIAEYARAEEEKLTQEAANSGVTPAPQTIAAKANKKAAAAAGVTVGAVRQAKQRAKAKEETAPDACLCGHPYGKHDSDGAGGGRCSKCTCEVYEQPESAAAPEAPAAPLVAPLPDGFNTFGLEVPPADRERIVESAQALGAWSRTVTNLLTELARIEKAANPLIDARAAEGIRDKAHALGHVIREAIPTSLCFYCKNDDRAVVNCPACGSTGFVGRHAGDNVPADLKTTGAAARIHVDGKYILASEPAPGPPPRAKPAKGKRGIRVVMENPDGSETDVPLDDVPPSDDEEPAF